MRLFVDDTREYPNARFQCCRTAQQAKLLLSCMEFEYITLDYDLGHGKESGLDILVWMKENNIRVPEINIHSNHVIGKERMREFIEENFPGTKLTMNMLMK
ncbi:MAG: hypothetical protein IKU19_07100 [Clostridia bacterium]|nr:hypothetical protein [Clostridia bacterium]